jgi:hypothetical protein
MRKRVYFVVLVVLVAALLAGCGSASKTSSSSANASAATATTAAAGATTTGAKAAKGPNVGPFKREGLAKPPVARPPVTTPALKQAFTKFAMCMRENGVKFPLPNTSGTGPIFSAKGVKISSAKFKTADVKCRGDLLSALRAHRGAVKAPGTTGATGSSGQAKTSPAIRPTVKVAPVVTRALQKFTACMREHGVTNYPEPEGASFNLSHTQIDTKSAQYKTAEKKCNPILNAAF